MHLHQWSNHDSVVVPYGIDPRFLPQDGGIHGWCKPQLEAALAAPKDTPTAKLAYSITQGGIRDGI
jgi:hypothetical protein